MPDATASRNDVARLFGRVAFGATQADLDTWSGRPWAEVVEHVLTPAALPDVDEAHRAVAEAAGAYGDREFGQVQLEHAQFWWLERMRTTGWPLRERMTLLWHDHFATGLSTGAPDGRHLLIQNETLRRHSLGNFAEMVAAMTVDPAMLEWLDGSLNVVGAPNENYARELFELFTMGVSPQEYTETDIREAARALSGWVPDGLGSSTFDPRRHDEGSKTVLGRRITNLAEREHLAVRDAALATASAPRFVAWKLVQKLAYDPGPANRLKSPDPLVVKVADELRRTNWDLTAAVRALLLADEFRYSPNRIVRQPVEQVVHACKVLGLPAGQFSATAALTKMGQRLFDPPNVGGWPVATEWLSPGTTLARYSFSHDLMNEANAATIFNLLPSLPASTDVPAWAPRLGLAQWSPSTEKILRDFVASWPAEDENQRRAGVLILALNSPDWVVM